MGLKENDVLEENKGEKDLPREEIKKVSHELNEILVELKNLLKVADYLGIKAENQKGKEIINHALEASKEEHYLEALDALREGTNFLKEQIDKKVEEEVMDLSLSVDGIQEESKSRKVNNLISKIENASGDEDYEKIPEYVFKAWEQIKKD